MVPGFGGLVSNCDQIRRQGHTKERQSDDTRQDVVRVEEVDVVTIVPSVGHTTTGTVLGVGVGGCFTEEGRQVATTIDLATSGPIAVAGVVVTTGAIAEAFAGAYSANAATVTNVAPTSAANALAASIAATEAEAAEVGEAAEEEAAVVAKEVKPDAPSPSC